MVKYIFLTTTVNGFFKYFFFRFFCTVMHNQNKIHRALKLISMLENESPLSIKFLANYFLISERSIYRYLNLIKELGFELKKTKSNKYYIFKELHNDYKVFLNNDEIALLKDLISKSNIISSRKQDLINKLQNHK